MKTLKKQIMRRIYTAYAMRLVGGTRARHFMVMVIAAAGLMRFVSVMHVAENFSRVQVGEIGDFIYSALTHTESWTLVVLALFVYAAVIFVRGEHQGRRAQFA